MAPSFLGHGGNAAKIFQIRYERQPEIDSPNTTALPRMIADMSLGKTRQQQLNPERQRE